MSKNITILGINYYPEDSAISIYTTQIAEFLAENNFKVTVITGYPYYPYWKIYKDYTNKGLFNTEIINGVKVIRFRQYVPIKPNLIKRIFLLITFTWGSFINLFKVSKPDVVLAIIPFTTTALLAWFLKLIYGSKVWIHIQDLEFDAAKATGLLSKKSKSIFKVLMWIEEKLYAKADKVSTISQAMLIKVKQKTASNTYYLPNWIDVSAYINNNTPKHKYLSINAFKILYAGNIGDKQNWNLFLNFLKAIAPLPNVEVIVVGDGSMRESVTESIKNFNFVKLYNLVPYHELPQLLCSTDLHILFQKADIEDTVMPSKVLGMMASGKPSIVTGNLYSEVACIFKASKGGFYFHGECINEIVEQIKTLINDPNLCKATGESAKAYVFKNYAKTEILNAFKMELDKIIYKEVELNNIIIDK